jgi:hypothetical protein
VTIATLSTGAHTHYSYDDAAMQVTTTTFSVAHDPEETAIADQNIKLLNGNGRCDRRRRARAGQWPTANLGRRGHRL